MSVKKMGGLVLTLALVCALFSGCSPKEADKEMHLTLKVPVLSQTSPVDPGIDSAGAFLEKAADAYMKEHPQVKIDVVVFGLTEEDASITDCFDTEDAADILYEGYFNMAGYVHTGRVVPLDDIISQALREDIPDTLWTMSQTDGKTYMMPFLSLENILSYNKALFRQSGLDAYIAEDNRIQSWTLEEWENILDTLAANRPESTFPMMMYAKNDQGDTHIMTLLRSQGSRFFDESGHFNLDTPEGIAALRWLKDGYGKGWFPVKCENLEIIDNATMFSAGQLGVYLCNNATLSYESVETGYVNFPSSDGKGMATSFVTGFEVFDNGDPAAVEASKDFVKYIYENEKWLDYSAGGIPASSRTAEKYKDDIIMLEEFYKNSANIVDFTANNPNWRGVRDVFWPHIHALLEGTETPEEAAKGIDEDCNAAIEKGWADSVLHE